MFSIGTLIDQHLFIGGRTDQSGINETVHKGTKATLCMVLCIDADDSLRTRTAMPDKTGYWRGAEMAMGEGASADDRGIIGRQTG